MKSSSKTPAKNLEADAEALHDALGQLVRIYQFRDRDRICCYDVSVTQCNAIETLVQRGALRLNTLAELLFLDKSTASRVVESLVRKEYARRVEDPEDRRAVQIEATRKGTSLYQRIRADLISEEKAMLADLPAEVRAGAVELLRRLARAAEGRTDGPACCAPARGK